MKLRCLVSFPTLLIVLISIYGAQGSPKVENASTAVVRAFETHDIVMFGEIHGNKQEYEWLHSLVATPEFSDHVDDIVVEFGNSLYQESVDRYVSGEDVPLNQVQRAWRNLVGAIGPPSPVYASLYQAVRETNQKRKGKHQMRIVCGDPYIDWEKVKDREDIAPYLGNRDQWYTQVVKDEVLAKHHRALLIMGWGHFLRGFPPGQRTPSIEQQLRSMGARTYLIIAGTNTTGGYDDLDHRFDSWSPPAVAPLDEGWVGELPAMPVLSGGSIMLRPIAPNSAPAASAGSPADPKLKNFADALLYLGPRDSLIVLRMPRVELNGTPYGKEIERRLTIEGIPMNFLFDSDEAPQFSRPEAGSRNAPPPLPPPPKNTGAPLPPRPPSQ
jgi:hypothetical protein